MLKFKPPPKWAHLPAPLRLLLMLAIAVILWLPLGLAILSGIVNPTARSLLALGAAYVILVLVWRWWGIRVAQRLRPLEYYGWVGESALRPLLKGLWLALGLILGIYILQGLLGWVTWQFFNLTAPLNFLRIVLEGGLVALGFGLAEEFVFRGWIWSELAQDYGRPTAAIASSSLFAILHFIKPWAEIWRTLPQFPGLLLLGLILAQYRRYHLSHAVGVHSGLIWGYYIIQVGGLVTLNPAVSPGLTGINENPLAGLLGIMILAGWLGLSRFLPAYPKRL